MIVRSQAFGVGKQAIPAHVLRLRSFRTLSADLWKDRARDMGLAVRKGDGSFVEHGFGKLRVARGALPYCLLGIAGQCHLLYLPSLLRVGSSLEIEIVEPAPKRPGASFADILLNDHIAPPFATYSLPHA